MFPMTLGVMLAYRTDVFIWTFVELMTPLVALAIWFSVASGGTSVFTSQETLTYYILIFLVRSATRSWVSFFLSQEILKGDLVKYLVRPMSVFWEHIADNITVKALRLALPVTLFAIVLWQFPDLFSPAIFEPARIGLFAASLLLAIILSFVFDAIFATLAFWVEDSLQISAFQFIFHEFASGVIIPFAVMPGWLLATLGWLPFRYTVSAPVEILMGKVVGMSAVTLFTVQSMWIVISLGILIVAWRAGLRQYTVPGQ